VCVVFYSAYTFLNRKVKSGVGELREGSLGLFAQGDHYFILDCLPGFSCG